MLPQARVDLKALKLVRPTTRGSLGSMTVAGPCAALGLEGCMSRIHYD